MPRFTKQRTKKARNTKHKTQNKKENTKEATNIHNKIEEGQIQDVWASFKANFGYSSMIQGRFVSVAGQYDLIRLIWLDFG